MEACRISELPEHILQHILSFLLVKDAVKTSLASKGFYNAWTTLPLLNFGESFSPTMTVSDEKLHELLDLVDLMIKTRLKQKTSIHKFILELPGYVFDLSSYINSFMVSITEANIKELVFVVRNRRDKRYTLPEAVYAAKTIDKLELQGFKLDSPSSGVKFSSLRELRLSKTYLDNNLIQLLISSSPNLEVLEFRGCQGFDNLQIFGSPKLKRIHLHDVDSFDNFRKIEIQAPSLEYLFYLGGRLFEVNLSACKSLKHLELHKLTLPVNWADDLLSDLRLLAYFSLIDCKGLESIRTSSSRLKSLFLWDCVNLVSLELDTPNLSSFTYYGDLSINLSLRALAIEHLCVGPPNSTPWCQNELLGFLGKFNHFKAVSLRFWDVDKAIVAKDVRVNFRSPLYGVKSLSLNPYGGVDKSMFLDLLDTLLWIAPCLDSLSLVTGLFKRTLLFIHEKSPKDELEDNSCCSSLPIHCWRHSLKKVKCVNLKDVEDEEKLKNYFLENAKMLESVDFVEECDHQNEL